MDYHGLQCIGLNGNRRFFVIYNWESIYKWIHGDDVELDIQKSVIYNKLSYFFNILNVNFDNLNCQISETSNIDWKYNLDLLNKKCEEIYSI